MDFDNEDDYQPGSYSPVMRGAERPLAPDHLRRVDRVAADHALAAWGQLRDRDPLDSTRAVELLAAAMLRFMQAASGKPLPEGKAAKVKRINKVERLGGLKKKPYSQRRLPPDG